MFRFGDYYNFIYLNTRLDAEQALEAARDCWNGGLTKYDALAFIEDHAEEFYGREKRNDEPEK